MKQALKMDDQIKTSSISRENENQLLSEERALLRRKRFWAITMLVIAIFFTMIYATLKNPFINTFSKIGNYYSYRGLYIFWAVVISFCFHVSTLLLFDLTDYTRKWGHLALALASFFLIITAIIPSVKEELFFLHVVHKWTTFFFVMSLLTAIHPYFVWLARRIPRLKKLLRNWQLVILLTCMGSLLIQGQTGIFELLFFLGTGTLLIYLCWVLFTEKIEKLENND
ncbi:MAG: hypothetical protein K9N05_02580 [Candidatus Marinimicrobia bacterium]|nr:hypothetical protein [Candidatus Neomarinimicrobiota bacterium]